jgi:hypothetical protein
VVHWTVPPHIERPALQPLAHRVARILLSGAAGWLHIPGRPDLVVRLHPCHGGGWNVCCLKRGPCPRYTGFGRRATSVFSRSPHLVEDISRWLDDLLAGRGPEGTAYFNPAAVFDVSPPTAWFLPVTPSGPDSPWSA